jgi:hypothetical protein
MATWLYEGISCYVSGIQQPNLVPLYRAWNGSDHFYTTNQAEYQGLSGTYAREGIACYVLSNPAPDFVPFYRLYKGSIDDHLYTKNPAERDSAIQHGYSSEGTQCFVKDSPSPNDSFIPLYRAYNSGICDHFYTTSLAELAAATGAPLAPANGAGLAHVTLNTLHVVKKQEVGRDEVYLWVYGVLVDARTIQSRNFIITHEGGHGNIGKSLWQGDARRIKDSVGAAVRAQLQPLFSFAAIGAIVAAWEEDYTPNSKVQEAYDATATTLNSFVLQRVNALNLTSPTEAELEQIKEDIKKEVSSIFKDAVDWWNPFSWDPDDSIGFDNVLVTINSTVAINIPFELVFKGQGAKYVISGSVGYSPV